MEPNTRYLVIGQQRWNQRVYEEILTQYPGEWRYTSDKVQVSLEYVRDFDPRYIFFLHWSYKVPADLLQAYECVCFHMTDVPYGRGGSPLQNLIVRGHRETKLTALRMIESFDAGPVYCKAPLSLEGGAEEIYIRAAYLSAQMILQIIVEHPDPQPQMGEPVIFKRRTPAESAVPTLSSLTALHDFIRMLDAENYPHAFIEHNGFRYEFRRAALYDRQIIAEVTITPIKDVME